MLKTKIIVSNNLNETETIKSLSSFGESSFNVLYKKPIELASYLLEKSGIFYAKKFISNDVVAAHIYKQITSIPFFKLFVYNDVLSLVNTIQDMRYQIVNNEKEKIHEELSNNTGKNNIFTEKNEAIIKAYDIIMNVLGEDNIDEVGLVRFAFANTSTFSDIEFIKYEYSHLRPLEDALINKASGKVIDETPIAEDKKLNIKRYTRAFGQNNEIEDIINYIVKNNIHFDECVIATTESKNYANILINYRDVLDIPVTIGTGKSILQTNPGKLLSLIVDWDMNHHRQEFLLRIIKDESFNIEKFLEDISYDQADIDAINTSLKRQYKISIDSFIDTVGRLKISFDDTSVNNQKYNNYSNLISSRYQTDPTDQENIAYYNSLKYVEAIINILNKGVVNFIESYAFNNDKYDNNALEKIKKMVAFQQYGVPKQDVIDTIMSQNVGRHNIEEGKLYFASINNACSCLRKHLFIVGLSSSLFPGKNVENQFLLDEDYLQFGIKDASSRTINENIDNYFFLLDLAKKYDIDVYLSWPIYNSETLKSQNASSVILFTYQKETDINHTINDFEKSFTFSKSYSDKYRDIEYFSTDLFNINKVGEEVANYHFVNYSTVTPHDISINVAFEQLKKTRDGYGFSASAVTTYAECPYEFFMNYGLGMSQHQDIRIFEVIPANEYGTLAHLLLENLDKHQTSLQEFLVDSEKAFDEYLIINPMDNPSLVAAKKKEFLDMMTNAYSMESYEPTILKEHDLAYTHVGSKVNIHGLPDKVILNPDKKTLRVIDYKTKNHIEHSPSKPSTMIQCTMYSYLVEQRFKKYKVSEFEYRYIKFKDRVLSVDMIAHYNYLTEILKKLYDSIETGVFAPNLDRSDDKCYFKSICKYRDICKK